VPGLVRIATQARRRLEDPPSSKWIVSSARGISSSRGLRCFQMENSRRCCNLQDGERGTKVEVECFVCADNAEDYFRERTSSPGCLDGGLRHGFSCESLKTLKNAGARGPDSPLRLTCAPTPRSRRGRTARGVPQPAAACRLLPEVASRWVMATAWRFETYHSSWTGCSEEESKSLAQDARLQSFPRRIGRTPPIPETRAKAVPLSTHATALSSSTSLVR